VPTDEEEVHDILSMPESFGGRLFFFYCFPLLVLFKFTIIDVRKKKWTNFYPITMITTVVWLAFMAEGMMTGAELAGCIMAIPEDVMGLTVAAAGTSLPNLFASLIVAKQGLGNMSVSNAFGSNTFNIFIALAVSQVCMRVRVLRSIALTLHDAGSLRACSCRGLSELPCKASQTTHVALATLTLCRLARFSRPA
jgi:Ca2+/Na+ antiporter